MSKYEDLYDRIKSEIINGEIMAGAKLPSVRKAAALYSVSRTTVQNAYFALAADGFIFSEPQSGYYVSRRSVKMTEEKGTGGKSRVLYDFKSGGADKDSFEFGVWRKYMKNALRDQDRLLTYSEPQGEAQLREVLAEYIREKRNVVASAGRIIIGAGVQSLLGVLCSLIEKKGTVSFPDRSFVQGAFLFSDYGFRVDYRNKNADIIYVSPSHMNKRGDVMPNKRRMELVEHSAANHKLIIEDDYESDFQYSVSPAPSLHALAGGGNVVYMGSFSTLLLPSIRISFMVLTPELAEKYRKNIFKYNQTAAKTEQIALCQYIQDGRLKAQIRKTRRFYTSKARIFAHMLEERLPDAKIEISENALQIILTAPFSQEPEIFEKNGIAVAVEKCENETLTAILNTGPVPQKKFEEAADAIAGVLKNNSSLKS